MEELSRVSCVRGYHVYRDIWDAVIGEAVICEREPHNIEDRYAVRWPRFFLAISFSTSLLAIAMAFEAKELHKGPLGSGRPSRGLKYCRIDIVKNTCSRSKWLQR